MVLITGLGNHARIVTDPGTLVVLGKFSISPGSVPSNIGTLDIDGLREVNTICLRWNRREAAIIKAAPPAEASNLRSEERRISYEFARVSAASLVSDRQLLGIKLVPPIEELYRIAINGDIAGAKMMSAFANGANKYRNRAAYARAGERFKARYDRSEQGWKHTMRLLDFPLCLA